MSIDELIRSELESAVSTVPEGSPAGLDVVESRGRRRRLVARVGVAGVGVAMFVAVVGVTLMVTRIGSTSDVTNSTVTTITSSPQAESMVTLGVGHVWPEQARALTPVELGSEFAFEVLGWRDAPVSTQLNLDQSGPVWVTINHPDESEQLPGVDVLTVPVDGGRVVIQIGIGGLSVTSEDTEGAGTVQINPARVPMAVTLEAFVRVEDSDEVIHLEADAADLIELGGWTAVPGTVQTVLVLYRDGDGQVIDAVGGHFTGPGTSQTSETVTTYAIGETVLIKTDCPVADEILRSDNGDGLPKKGQTDKERVENVFAETNQDLVDTFGAIEAHVIARNGQVWDGPGNGTYTIEDVPDYQIRVTLGSDAPCPEAPQSWNGIPVVFFRQ